MWCGCGCGYGSAPLLLLHAAGRESDRRVENHDAGRLQARIDTQERLARELARRDDAMAAREHRALLAEAELPRSLRRVALAAEGVVLERDEGHLGGWEGFDGLRQLQQGESIEHHDRAARQRREARRGLPTAEQRRDCTPRRRRVRRRAKDLMLVRHLPELRGDGPRRRGGGGRTGGVCATRAACRPVPTQEAVVHQPLEDVTTTGALEAAHRCEHESWRRLHRTRGGSAAQDLAHHAGVRACKGDRVDGAARATHAAAEPWRRACGVGEASADETDAHDTRCRAGKGHVPLKARADGAFEDDEQVVRTPLVDSEPAGREAQADELRGSHQRAKGIRLLVQQAAHGACLVQATRERAVDKVERDEEQPGDAARTTRFNRPKHTNYRQ